MERVHIYKNHIEGLKEQLTRTPHKLPDLKIAKKPFWDLKFEDFTLEGYDPVTDRKGTGGGKMAANDQVVTANIVVTPRGAIRGTVLNNTGTMPIDDATVNISVTGVSPWNYTTVSSPDGSFTFAGVPAGKFSIDAADPVTNLSGTASGTLTL